MPSAPVTYGASLLPYASGAKVSPVDVRDYRAAGFVAKADVLPTQASIVEHFGVLDQGRTSACVAFADAAFFEELIAARGYILPFRLSPWALYYAARSLENSIEVDAGLFPRTGKRALNLLGATSEARWPFNAGDPSTMPDFRARFLAGMLKLQSYQHLVSLDELKRSIMERIPVTIALTITDGLYYPDWMGNVDAFDGGGPQYGGHQILAVAYDDARPMRTRSGRSVTGAVRCRNSWSTRYGDAGYCWIAYEDFTNGTVYEMWTGR